MDKNEDRTHWSLFLESLERLESRVSSLDENFRKLELDTHSSTWRLETIQKAVDLISQYEARIVALESKIVSDKEHAEQLTKSLDKLFDAITELGKKADFDKKELADTISQNKQELADQIKANREDIIKYRNWAAGAVSILGAIWAGITFIGEYISLTFR